MGKLEGGCIVELGGLCADRVDDRVAVVAGIGAPEAGGAVEHLAAVGRVVVHALGARDQPGRGLEGAVGRERQPVGFEVVGDGDGRDHLSSFGVVMPEHSASKTRVNALMSRASTSFLSPSKSWMPGQALP